MKHIPLLFALIVTTARVVSGAKQGYFYASKKNATLSMSILVCVVHALIFVVGFSYHFYPTWNVLVLCIFLWAWSSFNAFRIWAVVANFNLQDYAALAKNIHLYEFYVTACGFAFGWLWLVGSEWSSLTWLVRDQLWLLFAQTMTFKYVLYSLLLLPIGMTGFKGFLNWGVGRNFLDHSEITDSASGSTWSIGTVNIPRPITWLRWTTLGDGLNRLIVAVVGIIILIWIA